MSILHCFNTCFAQKVAGTLVLLVLHHAFAYRNGTTGQFPDFLCEAFNTQWVKFSVNQAWLVNNLTDGLGAVSPLFRRVRLEYRADRSLGEDLSSGWEVGRYCQVVSFPRLLRSSV